MVSFHHNATTPAKQIPQTPQTASKAEAEASATNANATTIAASIAVAATANPAITTSNGVTAQNGTTADTEATANNTTNDLVANVCVNAENLIKMQERLAWLEASLGDANQQIEELFAKIDKLERQVRYLASITETPPAVRALTEETPPPHY